MPLLSSFGAASRGGFGKGSSDGPNIIPGPLSFEIPGGYSLDLRKLALAAGWDSVSSVNATVTSHIGSYSTGTPALTISGSFPGGLILGVNTNIFIVGCGGSSPGEFNSGGAGGPALSVDTTPGTLQIYNSGIIAGGGGAGGACTTLGGGGAGMVGGYGANYGTLASGGAGGGGAVGGSPGVNGAAAGSYSFNGGGGGGLGASGGSGRYNDAGDGSYSIDQVTGEIIWSNLGDQSTDGRRHNASISGGGAGSCTYGNANILWQVAGTRYGPLN